jgi:outer membrane immunogenic protein
MRVLVVGVFAAVVMLGTVPTVFAADMPVKAPVYKAQVSPPANSWTGFYVGGNVGGAWKHNTGTWNPLPSSLEFGAFPISGSNNGSGVIGGLHVGYNWQFAPTWVTGIEGDFAWTSARGSFSQIWSLNPPPGTVAGSFTNMSAKLDWVSSVRARLGYLVMPNLLAYGTGGVAWGKFDYNANNNNGDVVPYVTNVSTSSTQTGFAAGGGLEWAMTSKWLVRTEYLYYRFSGGPNVNAAEINFPTFPSNYVWGRTSVNVARAGLSYKF